MPPCAEAKAIPSRPTCNSVISVTPFCWQVSNSLAFMRREALAMSGLSAPTPLQNSWMPPPLPVASMMGEGYSGLERTKLSETSLAKGKTVDEPTARIDSRDPPPPAASPQAERARTERAANARRLLLIMIRVPSGSIVPVQERNCVTGLRQPRDFIGALTEQAFDTAWLTLHLRLRFRSAAAPQPVSLRPECSLCRAFRDGVPRYV